MVSKFLRQGKEKLMQGVGVADGKKLKWVVFVECLREKLQVNKANEFKGKI